jgi:hypothetical protein
MSLILLKAPPQKSIGMDAAIDHITPGAPPPLVTPHCRKCRIPVEVFEIDPISSIFYLGIEAQCHGKTGGLKVPAEQALKGGIVWMF